MANVVYTVDLGNGHVADIEGPEGATPEQLQAFVQQNPDAAKPQGYSQDANGRLIVDVPGPETEQNQPDQSTGQQILSGLGAGVRDIAGGAGQLLNLATSPIRAGLNALGLPGGDADYEKIADHIADQLGLAKTAPVQQAIQRGIVSGLLTGGIAAPVSAAAPAGSAAETIAGALSSAPLTDAAAQGASAGAGEQAKQSGYGVPAQIAASLLAGGVTGLAGAKLGAPRVAAPSTEGQQVAQAAERQNIPVLPADVGGPATRIGTSFAAQTPFGAVPLIKAARAANEAGGNRLGQIAQDIGVPAADVEGLGTAATEGAQRYAKVAKAAGGRLYDVAARKAGDAQIDLKNTRDLVDEQIARLQAVPGGGAGLKELQDLRATLDQPYSVQGVRDLRTEMFIPQEFRNTPVEARTRAVVNSAARDIEEGLRSQGRGDAADAFRAADDNWRNVLANLKRNIEPIVGKLDNLKSPEAVANALNSASKNNGARLASFVKSLPSEEQSVVRASLLNPLGRSPAGEFSLSKFATDWDKISPIAKRQAFEPEARTALDDLATVGRGSKAAKAYANHSNTGSAVITDRLLGTLATGASTAAGLPAFIATAAGQYGLGRLLASPRFARWLARSGKTTLSAPAYVDRLSRIAIAEPHLSSDINGLKDRLNQAFAQPSLAANPQQQPDNGVNGNGQQ